MTSFKRGSFCGGAESRRASLERRVDNDGTSVLGWFREALRARAAARSSVVGGRLRSGCREAAARGVASARRRPAPARPGAPRAAASPRRRLGRGGPRRRTALAISSPQPHQRTRPRRRRRCREPISETVATCSRRVAVQGCCRLACLEFKLVARVGLARFRPAALRVVNVL